MYLTSVTNLKLDKDKFNIVDSMSYRAKALYNSCLYEINNHFELTGEYLNYSKTDLLMKNHITNFSYKKLPAQISQQIIKKLHKNYSSFFKLLNKKQTKEYDKNIKTPKYKGPDDRKELIFIKSTGSSFSLKDGCVYISIPKDFKEEYNLKRLKIAKIPPYIDQNSIKIIEIVPKLGSYELHIKYEQTEKQINQKAENWYSIDLGLNNLCTVTSNIHSPFILNGRGIKGINQKFNKKISKLKSKLNPSQKTSNLIQSLWNKRGYKLNNEIHKITDFIVKSIEKNDIDFVVIGYNKEWKQNINIGKRNNQNFVQIPFQKIIQQLQYKLKLKGIEVFLQEESYTSKTSYFDNEPIKKQQTYKGKRIKRGLFKTGSGIYINSDVNGSLNIYRKFIKTAKVVHDVLLEPVDIGLVMNPVKINIRTDTNNLILNSYINELQIRAKNI